MEDKKGFFKRWKEGILNLSSLQQLNSKIIGTIGGLVGLVLAFMTLLYQRMWGFGIFVFFFAFIQAISLIGMRQQYLALKKMMEEIEPQSIQEETIGKKEDIKDSTDVMEELGIEQRSFKGD